MTNQERDELLIRLEERLKGIDEALKRDYRILHGNGQPGLIQRVQELEDFHKNENGFIKKYGGVIGWIVTTVIAIYSVIKHHN